MTRTAVLLVLLVTGVLTTETAHAQAAAADAAASPTMFPKETWTLELYGVYYHSFHKDDNLASAVAAGGYYFSDRHAVRAEVVGLFLNNEEGSGPDSDDSFGAGVNVGLRYHFYERDRVTLFFEGLVGLFYGRRNFPERGTHFNFDEQLGLGATYRIDENVHLMGGLRYIHISNARIHGADQNPSFDGLGAFVGLLFSY